MIAKIVKLCKDNEKDLFLAATIILVAAISFGLGRLSKIREEKTPITIESAAITTEDQIGREATVSSQPAKEDKIFVASKNGKKYYYAWCDAAKIIKDQNKVWFATAEEAQKAGYEPAGNCRGLK